MSTHTTPPRRTGAPPPPPPPQRTAPPPRGPAVNPLGTTDEIDGIPAFGTLIQVLTNPGGTPETYETIAGVGDITGPANTMAEVDVTSHSSGAPIKQTIPGLIDLGDISFPCFWNPADPTQNVGSPYGLEYLFINRIITKFRLIMPDPTHRAREFKGFVKGLGEDYKVAGVCTRNVAIRITSPMTDVNSPIKLTPDKLSTPGAALPTSTFDVETGGDMAPWSAISDAVWLTVTDPIGETSGDQTVTFSVEDNVGGASARTGHINMANLNLTFTVTQTNV